MRTIEPSRDVRKAALRVLRCKRALALDPEVVLFDEPTTGLDPTTSATIGALIRSIQRRLGVTSIVVTHDLPLARRVGDRLGYLAGGRFAFIGDWAEAEEAGSTELQDFLAGREEREVPAKPAESESHAVS